MSARNGGVLLAAAAGLFWLAWVLMPGVGVTDAAQIFALVSSQRRLVAVSVVVQLVSAALYAPALLSIARVPGVRGLGAGAGLLLVGAMGSAADAVLHLLAYAMTAPGLDLPTLTRVMAFMQGPGLLIVAPLIACFFAGGAAMSIALAHARIVPAWHPWLHVLALAAAAGGGALASAGVVPPRIVGLTVLALFSAPQFLAGLALARRLPRAVSPQPRALGDEVVALRHARGARGG
jgi:hypothetical protein